jgi:hypothetical protein
MKKIKINQAAITHAIAGSLPLTNDNAPTIFLNAQASHSNFKCQSKGCEGDLSYSKLGSSDDELWTCDACGQTFSCAEDPEGWD